MSYFRFAHALRFIVNDIGMVFFVGLVTEEALESVMPGGALHRWRRTLLPIVAAVGSVLGATAIYVLYLRERSEFMLLEGWPVAAAQDVALAYFMAKAIFPERRGPARHGDRQRCHRDRQHRILVSDEPGDVVRRRRTDGDGDSRGSRSAQGAR